MESYIELQKYISITKYYEQNHTIFLAQLHENMSNIHTEKRILQFLFSDRQQGKRLRGVIPHSVNVCMRIAFTRH